MTRPKAAFAGCCVTGGELHCTGRELDLNLLFALPLSTSSLFFCLTQNFPYWQSVWGIQKGEIVKRHQLEPESPTRSVRETSSQTETALIFLFRLGLKIQIWMEKILMNNDKNVYPVIQYPYQWNALCKFNICSTAEHDLIWIRVMTCKIVYQSWIYIFKSCKLFSFRDMD